MSWIAVTTLLALGADCGELKIDAEQARAIFRVTIAQQSPEPKRYLGRALEPRFRCEEGRGVWIISSHGPSGSFDDSELVVIDANSGRADHATAPCAAPLALTADQARTIAVQFGEANSVRWSEFHERFLRSHCRQGAAPHWLFSAMHRSLAPDTMLLIQIDDGTSVASDVPQG